MARRCTGFRWGVKMGDGGGAGGGRGSVRRRSHGGGGVSESASHDREPRPAPPAGSAVCWGRLWIPPSRPDAEPANFLSSSPKRSPKMRDSAGPRNSQPRHPPPPAETPPSPDRNRGVPAPPPPLFFGASPRRAVSGKPPVSQTPSLDARGTGRLTRPSPAALGGGGGLVFKTRRCVLSSFKMAAVPDQDGGDR